MPLISDAHVVRSTRTLGVKVPSLSEVSVLFILQHLLLPHPTSPCASSFNSSLTKTSSKSSSGMSVSLAPWNLGITSCFPHPSVLCDQLCLSCNFSESNEIVRHFNCGCAVSRRPRPRVVRGKNTAKTNRMAATKRIDIKESEDLVALEDLEGGDITCSTKEP